jgi:flagellar protein FliS
MDKKMCRNYLENEVFSATKEKLVLLIYDKLLSLLKGAINNIEEKNIVDAHKNIIKAETIIFHLINHLDFKAGQISNNLFKIYEFSLNQLKEANIKKDAKLIKNIIDIFKELREGWYLGNLKKEDILKEGNEGKKLNYSI